MSSQSLLSSPISDKDGQDNSPDKPEEQAKICSQAQQEDTAVSKYLGWTPSIQHEEGQGNWLDKPD